MSHPGHDIYNYDPQHYYEPNKYTIKDYQLLAEVDIKIWEKPINWHDPHQQETVIKGFFNSYADCYPSFSVTRFIDMFEFYTNKQLSTINDIYKLDLDYYQESSSRGKTQQIESDYPQVVLSPRGEYATTGSQGEQDVSNYNYLVTAIRKLKGQGDINYVIIEYLGEQLTSRVIDVRL